MPTDCSLWLRHILVYFACVAALAKEMAPAKVELQWLIDGLRTYLFAML